MQRVRVTDQAWGTHAELCSPERRNALDPQTVAELHEAVTRDASGPILLTAAGPAFCAGGDLRVLQQAAAADDLVDVLTTNAAAFADLIEAIVDCRRPVVAVLDGPAVGGGASLALACDIRVATRRARLVFNWSSYGLPPDGHASTLLAWVVGRERAQSLLADAAEITTKSELASQVFSGIVEKRQDRRELLAAMRANRAAELAAIARVAADEATGKRLAVLYKIDT
jgi:2-(1,2-epoxy-1,2-dihydrophenyl)acetyl-CoA isomerase